MSAHPLALPILALIAWTMVIFCWMYVTRIPAMMKAGIDLKRLRGGTGRSLDEVLPREVQWKAHNYNHLLEQPVLFYAVCLLLILVGAEAPAAMWCAWAYVALRIVHSLVQATTNVVRVRFTIFLLSSIALIGLIMLAAIFLLA